ncbi:hypothetical protein V6N13_028205 [Hibiscus sabdariffa]
MKVAAATESSTSLVLGLNEIFELKMYDIFKLSSTKMIQRGSNRKPSLVGYAIKVAPTKNKANASPEKIAALRARADDLVSFFAT